jgi:hypothetical protein
MTHRMLDGKIIETQEEMAECGLHGGDWDNQGGLCIIRDLDEYANYIDHVRTDIRLGQERAEDEEEAAKAESSDSIPVKQGIPLSDLRLEKYAPRNWMKISVDSHLNHLLMHVFAYLAGDRQEEHLTHALARAAMAVEIEKLGVQD